MTLATDIGRIPMNVAAVLVLGPTHSATSPAGDSAALGSPPDMDGQQPPADLTSIEDLLVARISRIPRFRQKLVNLPWGLGRPIWLTDDGFAPRSHITTRRCPAPGGVESLLDLAGHEVIRPLPRTRPLWRVILVHHLSGGRVGVILVIHHVLTDGIGGLAVLAALADGADLAPPAPSRSQPAPTSGVLARDNIRQMARSLRSAPKAINGLGRAMSELGARHRQVGSSLAVASRCSLNTATSGELHVSVVDIDLAPLVAAAHQQGATVNDLLLVAVTGAMEAVLRARGERVPSLVVSVPISARLTTTSHQLGNRVGVMPVRVPLAGSLADRVRAVAALTSAQKGEARGSSTALLGPVLRGLAALGIFTWFVDRQVLINTILSNLRGPAACMQLGGWNVDAMVPIAVLTGNVTVGFTALSYAGRLVVSVATDPVVVPDSQVIAEALHGLLQCLASTWPAGPPTTSEHRRAVREP